MMKVLTLNFLSCAVKACKSSSDSFPLHPKDAELASDDVEINPQLLANLLPRIDWKALRTTSTEASISLLSSLLCNLGFGWCLPVLDESPHQVYLFFLIAESRTSLPFPLPPSSTLEHSCPSSSLISSLNH